MTGGRLTGSTDLLTYYGLVTCYKKYISQTIDPTLFSFVADLPGKTTVEPDGYLMDLLHDPHIEADSANTIRPLDMATLKESYHLREGPVPGFDVSLLGTDDDGGRNSGQYIDKDVYGISDGERKHKKKKKKRKHSHEHDDDGHSDHKKKKKRKKEREHSSRRDENEGDNVIVD